MDNLKIEKEKFKGIYLLPNLFTIGALFAGFYAIVAATKGLFEVAAIALFIAMLLDNLDGRVARLTNTQSDFGAQLDSLSDMVAFGLAPALIVYHWSLMGLGKIGWLAAFFYTATAALRLARFNSQLNVADKKYFKGLPAPVAAAVVVGFVWNCAEFEFSGKIYAIAVLSALLTSVIAVLMISNVRYYSFKTIDFKGKVPFLWALLIVLLLIIIVLEPAKVLFLGCLIYALSGIFMTFYRKKDYASSQQDDM
jgi:CDP-diacylglycerol--serine O-phosphatidyltransferase